MEAIQRSLPTNLKDEANIFSKLFFIWTAPIFRLGYQKVLDVADLFQPLRADRSQSLGDRLDKEWQQQQIKIKSPSLVKVLLKTFWKEIFFMGLLAAINELGFRLVQPILLGELLMFFRFGEERDEKNRDDALYYGASIVILTALGSLAFNHFTMIAFHNGMKIRVAVCSVIYRKALRLSRTALGDTAPGKVVNLLSNDVSRFDLVAILFHSMWSAPLLALIVGILLWNEIQYAGLVGILVVFLVVPIQSYTGKLSSKFRYQTAVRTDERVRFMDEIISGVQVIKMYAWEIPFSKLITLARRMELKIILKNSYVRALYMTFNLFTTRAAIFCTMLTLALTGGSITAARIFVVSSYFNVIAFTMSQMFVRGVAEMAEAWVSVKRLQKFLEYDEKEGELSKAQQHAFLKEFDVIDDKKAKSCANGTTNSGLPPNIMLQLKSVTAKWPALIQKQKLIKTESSDKTDCELNSSYDSPTLNNISIDFKKGSLIGVIGSVGAGKSSLLQVILEELPIESGSMIVQGKLSYACQEPWVFGATVRQNILFGQEMEKLRYDSVVKSCALLKDFEQFPSADSTVIGEKGASLSGGQKARISLARAVYREADVYLLDDPLSAVDTHVGRHLFDEVIGPNGRLAKRNTTRILVTHQVHFLKDADWVVVISDGKIQMQGTPSDLSKSGINFAELLEQDEEQDVVSLSGSKSLRSSEQSLASSHHAISSESEEDAQDAKRIEEAHQLEATSKGTVKGSVAGNYLKASGSYIIPIVVLFLFLLTQFSASFADYWVSYWTKQEELRTYYNGQNITIESTGLFSSDVDQIENTTSYADAFNSSTNATQRTEESTGVAYLLSTDFCMSVHGLIIIAIFAIGISRSIVFFTMAIRASQKMHDGMFSGLIRAPMRFFDTNPSGRILNRFSKDMGTVDEFLPKALLDALQIILSMVGAILVTSIVQPIFLILVLVLGVFFLIIRKIYLKTSKNIKRLEGMTKSPVFTHLAASLGGLSTIRAFEAQEVLIKEFDAHQDLHTAAWYMFISTSTAFGLSLDIICLVFMGCVTFFFLLVDTGATGDEVGLAITQTMALTGLLQWGIRQSAEVANQLMSVERLLEYRDLEVEKEPKKLTPIGNVWPQYGKLEFRNVVYRYFDGAEAVLKGINFVIKPNEKIGIVGRTGAGKSSLIGAIFRLAKIEGDILIDNVNTDTITLQNLRSKVSIIPQDPVLFSGTLRRNLDPFEEYPDSVLWKSLEAVELKDIASGPLGLQAAVTAGGGNFSVGQRQLVCLARAILRNNKILVLDEATANVDPHTDSLIQKTIRERFSSCTVLTIAHRLHTIMDSDRVLVLNFGVVEEFDNAYELLQNPGSIFKDMVMATGPQESERLQQLANEKHQSSIEEL